MCATSSLGRTSSAASSSAVAFAAANEAFATSSGLYRRRTPRRAAAAAGGSSALLCDGAGAARERSRDPTPGALHSHWCSARARPRARWPRACAWPLSRPRSTTPDLCSPAATRRARRARPPWPCRPCSGRPRRGSAARSAFRSRPRRARARPRTAGEPSVGSVRSCARPSGCARTSGQDERSRASGERWCVGANGKGGQHTQARARARKLRERPRLEVGEHDLDSVRRRSRGARGQQHPDVREVHVAVTRSCEEARSLSL